MPKNPVLAELENVLRDAALEVEGSHVRIVTNSDGSIDGEIVAHVERGESVEEVAEIFEEATRGLLPDNSFVSVGFRWEPGMRDEKLQYDRHRGLFQLFTAHYENPAEATATLEAILNPINAKGKQLKWKYHKPQQVVWRVHWNRHGERPERESK